MNALIIVNDPPYGTERAYNALRLATALAKQGDATVRVFLLADAVACAKRGQQTAKGYYNIANMVRAFLGQGGEIGLCGSCMDARGLGEAEMLEGARRSSMEELAAWTTQADRILTF